MPLGLAGSLPCWLAGLLASCLDDFDALLPEMLARLLAFLAVFIILIVLLVLLGWLGAVLPVWLDGFRAGCSAVLASWRGLLADWL
jgi:hypothetical protein